jgi:hypothetical protein
MIELPRKAKGQRAAYFGDRTIDNMLSMMMALAGEVVVLRERLDSAERLLSADGSLTAQIDAYRPTGEAIAAREAWRAQFVDLVLRPIQQEYEGLEEKADQADYSQVVDRAVAMD